MENEKNSSNSKLVLFVVLAIIVVVIFLISSWNSKEETEISSPDQMMQTDGVIAPEEVMEKEETQMMVKDTSMTDASFEGNVLAGVSAPLIEFNQSDYEKALNSDKLIVLYFYANWCPTCKKEFADALKPFFDELDRDDVVGFRVSFNDNETNNQEEMLAKEFGVAYQHTKVFLKNKERVLKAPDSWNKQRYFQEIQKY